VGREQELVDVTQRLLDPACHLLTVIGPGGIGKTRLALAAAGRLLAEERFPGGIFFMPLAATDSTNLLVSAIAEPFSVIFQSGADPKTQLLDYLSAQKRPLLLVLDNFEHLVDGATLLAEIVPSAPAVKLLVTSRQRLDLSAEWLFDLFGLPFPTQVQPDDDLASFAAVRLFVQTATRLKASFTLSDEDGPHVARICGHLEGMPLGLELAAAWVRTLSCQQIADELAGNIALLDNPLRDAPARHRSLPAVFDHSWRLLSAEEQRVFRRLSVFRGGFAIHAAQEVTGASLPTLMALVDKSLLRSDDRDRLGLHELLRRYGSERLLESGEAKQVRHRHLTYFLLLAEGAELKLRSQEQGMWLKKLATEDGNFRAALAWSLEERDAFAGLRLAAALGQYWYMRSRDYGEGATWLKRLLVGAAVGEQPALRAKALLWLGLLAHYLGDDTTARPALRESLTLCQTMDDRTGMGDAHLYLGDIASYEGDDDEARAHYAAARSAYESSLIALREHDDAWTLARTLNCLGEIARTEDDYAAARAFYEESLTHRRMLADQRGLAVVLYNLGHVALHQGNVLQGTAYFGESLVQSQHLGDERGIADGLTGLAGALDDMERPAQAAMLFGAADALYADSVARLEYPDQIEYERNVAAVRAHLDAATFAQAWAEGRAMPQEYAVGYALALALAPAEADADSDS
jgi:predicted ATPase